MRRIQNSERLYMTKHTNHIKRENDMKDQTRAVFVYDRTRWHLVKLISGRLLCHAETGEIRQCTGSDTIRELLDGWIDDHAIEWFPKLLKDFEKQGIQNNTTKYMTEALMDYIESAKINKAESELETVKDSMLKAGWTEAECDAFMKGEK